LLAENTCTANVFLDALQLFVLEETDDSEQKKKARFCLNKTVLHPFSAMNYEMSCSLDFLIGGLEQAEQQRGCHEAQTSYQWVLSMVFIKYLLKAEKSRDLSHL